DEPGTRLHTEQQFWEGKIQVLVATEAAGEGINLQCCHIMLNYDIPWNPNRLEQRMGRIHRYGQQYDCLIFNFVATNTIEGQVLRVVPETVARFLLEAVPFVPYTLRPIPSLPHSFEPVGTTPLTLRQFERDPDWRLPAVANRYPRCSADRDVAGQHNLEWVTP